MNSTLCIHRWLIDPANGPFSAGVCRNCGESRQFHNSRYGGAERPVTPAVLRAIRIGRREMGEILSRAEQVVFNGHDLPTVRGRVF